MVFVGYGDRFGVKAYRLYDPIQRKFHFARSVHFDETSLLSPQPGEDPLTKPNPPLLPTPPPPTLPVPLPQVEWQESEPAVHPVPQQAPQQFHPAPLPAQQPNPTSPNPIPTPQRPPPWSLGRKSNTFLFPQSPNPLFPRRTLPGDAQWRWTFPLPNPTSPLLPSSATRTTSSTESDSPILADLHPADAALTPLNTHSLPAEQLNQFPVLDDSPASRSPAARRFKSLQEIYKLTNISVLLDSAVQPDHVLGDHPKLIPTQLLAAEAFYLQVLHATSDAPSKDPGALPFTSEPVDGITMSEALAGPDASLWRQAMDSEYQSLLDNGTWELVPAPPQRKLVTCKWLLRKKLRPDGTISRYKARLVARGFSQVPGIDYGFSPVLRITSFRVLIALAAQFRFLIHQMDVRIAFLHGDLEEEIYMKQPPGYVSTEHPNYVCKLLKSLYGLKQSSRQWYRRFHQCMLDLGYIRFTSEPNIYTRHTPGVFFLLAIYVDDILLLSSSEPALLTTKEDLQSVFSMTDMGSLHFCLGIQTIDCPFGSPLNESGRVMVNATTWQQFCEGTCVNQTLLELTCISGVLGDFRFNNDATVSDVKTAIQNGCATGNFTVHASPNGANFVRAYGGPSSVLWIVLAVFFPIMYARL
ncbi:hypothetical protein L7F22_040616 [Adiantum nelumboides]|nr:hypothetical protein [Adiantum nelumboides]